MRASTFFTHVYAHKILYLMHGGLSLIVVCCMNISDAKNLSQVPVYATLVGLVNVDLPDFGRKVINAVHEQLEIASTIDDFLVSS